MKGAIQREATKATRAFTHLDLISDVHLIIYFVVGWVRG